MRVVKAKMKNNFEYISNNLYTSDLENSPLKVLKTYFKEKLNNENEGQKTTRTLGKLKKIRVVENEIFKNREPSGKSLKQIIGGMRYFKDPEFIHIQREQKKSDGFSNLSIKHINSNTSLQTNSFTHDKRTNSTTREIKHKEDQKSQSNRELASKNKFFFNRLSKIRNNYQENLIQHCRKLTKQNKWS